jgi:DinB superfamily
MAQAVTSRTEQERETLIARLKQSRELYLGTLKNVSDTAARVRPTAETWSILDVSEHVAVAERQMLSLWMKRAEPGQADRAIDEEIVRNSEDRNRKQVAPEGSRPRDKMPSVSQAIEQFDFYRGQSIAYLEGELEDLRAKTVTHPLAGRIDGYQLFLLMACHAERHARQIQELKAGAQ